MVRYYLSSGQNEVAEYDGAGQRLRYYVHGPTYIDERVVMHNDPVAGGAATTGSDYIYLLKDLYTVAGMADERGWPVERYDYDAYGKVYMERVRVLPWAADFDGDGDVDDDDLAVVHAAYRGSGQEPNGPRGWRADLDGDGDVDGSDYALFADAYRGSGVAPGGNLSLRSASMVASRIGNPYFFTGRRLDVIDIQNAGTPHHFTDDYAGLQLYDYRARTYDPVVGRFGQRDPFGLLESSIRYLVEVGPLLSPRPLPQAQYRHGGNLWECVRGKPDSRTDSQGLFTDKNGEECDIKSCRRYYPGVGHTWIEFPDGSVSHFPDYRVPPVPTNHNDATFCSEVNPRFLGRVPLPQGGTASAACFSCDQFKDCIRNVMAAINADRNYFLIPILPELDNCISAKNKALSQCGLTDDSFFMAPPDDPTTTRPPDDSWYTETWGFDLFDAY